MFSCGLFSGTFWFGFIAGGIICVSIFEFIQFLVLSAMGVRGLQKELKRKNDLFERKELRQKLDISERKEPKL